MIRWLGRLMKRVWWMLFSWIFLKHSMSSVMVLCWRSWDFWISILRFLVGSDLTWLDIFSCGWRVQFCERGYQWCSSRFGLSFDSFSNLHQCHNPWYQRFCQIFRGWFQNCYLFSCFPSSPADGLEKFLALQWDLNSICISLNNLTFLLAQGGFIFWQNI